MGPESREIDNYKKHRTELVETISDIDEAIWDYKDMLKEKRSQLDMVDYLIVKLKERMDEKATEEDKEKKKDDTRRRNK